jgi:hypothetical protein
VIGQKGNKLENSTVPEAPWRKWPEHKPENGNTVIAVKRWPEDGKLHGGENCYIEGRGWCNFLGIPNASSPEMWMPMQDYLDYCKKYGTPIK